RQAEALKTAQSRRARRPVARYPDGIGHDDGVRGERSTVPPDGRLEVRGPDLLLQLPQQMDVERDVVIDGVLGAEEGGERRALVVGGAPTEVTIAAPGEAEGIAAPFRLARGLHVEVVVDGDGRQPAVAVEVTVDERMAAGRDDGRVSAEGADETGGRRGGAADVAGACRVGGDAGQLDQRRELALVSPADVVGVGQQRGTREAVWGDRGAPAARRTGGRGGHLRAVLARGGRPINARPPG